MASPDQLRCEASHLAAHFKKERLRCSGSETESIVVSMNQYQIGGSLSQDHPYYVQRQADVNLYHTLKMGQFCYVFNARQMGKSSLMVRVFHQLQHEGIQCAAIDLSRIGSDNITPEQWYKGFAIELWQAFNLFQKVNFKSWWQEHTSLSCIQRLGYFIEQIVLADDQDNPSAALEHPTNLVLFLDEVDSVRGLGFALDDFFALIRTWYNQRSLNPAYQRLTVVLLGVVTPSDLMSDHRRTPFNIGRAIALEGFQWAEAQPLAQGLVGYVSDPQLALQEILKWTEGQPFLTQKLCQLVVEHSKTVSDDVPDTDDRTRIAMIVKRHIIDSWEFQDEPEHLRTIRDRLLGDPHKVSRLLSIYQQILTTSSFPPPPLPPSSPLPFDSRPEHLELLLSGLVVNRQGYLAVKNPIYQAVFNLEWVNQHLTALRPYARLFDRWIASGQRDESYLLRGQHLQDALVWALGKNLGDQDYQFLVASQELAKRETASTLEAIEQANTLLANARQQVRQVLPKQRIDLHWLPKIALGLTIPILMLQLLGVWQSLELGLLDQFFRWRPLEPRDQRITVITIDEQDFNQFGYPIPDQVLAQGITTLKAYQPRAIGLDLYRNLKAGPGHDQLIRVFQSTPNLIGIEKIVGKAIAPPPALKQLGQISFSDQVEDADGRVRRALLSLVAQQQVHYGLATALSLEYLKAQGITIEAVANGRVRLGQAIFQRFTANAGGYVRAQSGGYQILLNYRGSEASFDRFALHQLISRHIPAENLRDRLILIGTTAESAGDLFYTPYSSDRSRSIPMPGVILHANITSQILSAALDGRPLMQTWPESLEWLWVLLWATIGAGVSWHYRLPLRVAIAIVLLNGLVIGGSYLAFLQGVWVPVVPVCVGLSGAAIGVLIVTQNQLDQMRFRQTLEVLLSAYQQHPVAGRIAIEYLKQSESKKNQDAIKREFANIR
jgi:CHASE2 domain-containing sensor protein